MTPESTFTNNFNTKDDYDVINVGLLAAGMMAREHISYLKNFKNVRLKWICDPDSSSIEKALAMFVACKEGDGSTDSTDEEEVILPPRIFTNEQDMLDCEQVKQELHLLVIATPNHLHTPQLLRWAQRPVTILCEKPVAISEGQVAQLRAQSNTFQADIWIAMEYRYIGAIQKLLQLLPKIGPLKKIAIRENRYPFLNKVQQWNKDINKSGDTLVEKCCHFFDLFRLISKSEMNTCTTMVHRGLNWENYGYHKRTDNPVPIIDSAYVLLDFHPVVSEDRLHQGGSEPSDDDEMIRTTGFAPEYHHLSQQSTIGCLELCMFAEGSRHQEEIVVTGLKGRLEAYLPENKVYFYQRPNEEEWPDRSIPPPRSAIKETVFDCSDLSHVYPSFAKDVPRHSGYHYCSTSIEWKHLIDQIHAKRDPTVGMFTPHVSLEDGIRAVEMGIDAMKNISNTGGNNKGKENSSSTSNLQQQVEQSIYPIVACVAE
jgi:predicted dehydrogenase